MIISLKLPAILPQMTEAAITAILSVPGPLKPGAPLFDVRVDLSAVALQDCPPVSYYRLALREAVWLRRILVVPDARPAVGTVLALFSTTADEDLDQPAARAVRHMIAGILGGADAPTW